MPALQHHPDPDGLLEYSVVYTDRALNHMSAQFQGVMRDISRILKTVYQAHSSIVVPGGGTFGMEAVARQFAQDQTVLVLRNGWFSYRWSQIFDVGRIPSHSIVCKARAQSGATPAPFTPAPLDEVVATIHSERPALVFAPHVETASGMILPDTYLRSVSEAVRAVDGMLVLDCVASGTVWVDMQDLGVDVLISAPQKGWSGPSCAALIGLSGRARQRIEHTTSSSFACDLKKWLQIMEVYENGGHAYHATLPTDALCRVRDVMLETEAYGFDKVCAAQWELGQRVRTLLEARGFASVAAPGFQAPGVVVSYTTAPDIHNGRKFAAAGIQSAAGVPLMCDEAADFRSFRLGLFGLDKLHNPEAATARLATALDTF